MSLFPSIFVPLRVLPLPDPVFLPCDHGLDFDISLRDNSINKKGISFDMQQRFRVFVRIIGLPVVKLLTYLYESSQLSCVSSHIYNLLL